MFDIDTEEELVRKVGGKFSLTTLLQKRMVELNRGAPPLVKVQGDRRDLRRIVCQEVLENKIALTDREEVTRGMEEEKARIESATVSDAKTDDPQEIYGSDIKKIKEQRIKELSQLLNPKK
jgi:DNA-directed RNA polymerase subunit omega